LEVNLYDNISCQLDNGKITVLWSFYDSSKQIISIPALIDGNLARYRSEYVELVDSFRNYRYKKKRIEDWLQIGEVSFWWGSLIQEKSVYKTPEIYSIFKFMALRDYCKKNRVSVIRSYLSDKKDAVWLASFCADSQISLLSINKRPINSEKQSIKDRLVNSSMHLIKSFGWLGHYFLERRPSKHSRQRKNDLSPKFTVMSYLPNLDIEKGLAGEFHSFYWGNLIKEIEKKGKGVNHLFLFTKSPGLTLACAKKIRKALEKSSPNNNFFFLEDFLQFAVIIKSAFSHLRMALRSVSLSKSLASFKKSFNHTIPIDKILRESWLSSIRGVCSISGSLYHELFNRYLSTQIHQECGLYLMENHGWERALIKAWKNNNNGVLIGYAHSSVREDDLRYFNSDQSINSESYQKFFPEKIAVNTESEKGLFFNQGYNIDQVFRVESARYSYLRKLTHRTQPVNIQSILILTDIDEESTHYLLNICRSVFIKSNYKVAVKPHPLLRDAANLVSEYLNCSVVHEHLSELLNKADFVILSSATTAVLEVRAMGIPYAAVLNPKMFNLSPLPADKINTVSSVAELKQSVSLAKVVEKPLCDFVFDENFSLWKELMEKQHVK
jgi:surface carbohydrate biosynthesis protein (TIGR04326 family)